MGDLISRSALLKHMEETEISQYIDELNNGNDNYSSTPLYDFVKDMPTAYSVEDVVAELEEENQRLKKLRNDCIALSDHEVCDIENKAYNFAIKCVRNGGKE